MAPPFSAALGRLGNLGRSLGPRTRKLLRYLGFALLGLITFVFAFQLTFPFDRVKDKVVEALSPKYEVTIGDVERGILPGRMYFKAFSLRTRPTKASDVATTFYIEKLEIDLGLLALLRGTVAVNLDAKIGPGHIKGKVALARTGTTVDVDGDDLPSASLPMREALGLPMSGKVRFAVELDLPNETPKGGKSGPNWAKASGSFEFACPSGCAVGDGKSKLKLTTNNARSQAFLDEGGGGIDFGKVNIDSLIARVEIKNGKLDITRFEAKSPDGELQVAFGMALNQDINASLVTGCLRFRGSEALLKREPKTHAAISTTGAPLGPDNLFHIRLDGPLRQVRRLGQICGPSVNTSMDNPAGAPPRPNLTVPPEPPPGSAAAPGHVANPPSVPPPAAIPPPTPAVPGVTPVSPGLPPPGATQGTPPGVTPVSPGLPPPGATQGTLPPGVTPVQPGVPPPSGEAPVPPGGAAPPATQTPGA